MAWDTYAKGDYDVYCRVWSDGRLRAGHPRGHLAGGPDAAQRRLTIRSGPLWIAYEESPEHWGKDWGRWTRRACRCIPGRSIAVRVWADGKLLGAGRRPAAACSRHASCAARQARVGETAAKTIVGQSNWRCPALATDAAGRVWLAVRTPAPGFRCTVGSMFEHHAPGTTAAAGRRQIVCPHTDNTLDNRPALVALPSGEMLLVTSCDGPAVPTAAAACRAGSRSSCTGAGKSCAARPRHSAWPDPVNNELVMAVAGSASGHARGHVELQPVGAAAAAAMPAEAQAEAAAIARCRAARVQAGGKTLRLLRGEFHRHTEISPDGGGDGMLMDMWRYALDAAGLDWIGNGDHDNGDGREYSWWITQKTTDLLHTCPARFTPMFTYERSCRLSRRPPQRGLRPARACGRCRGWRAGMGKAMDDLPPDAPRPHSPDTQMLYRYLEQFDGVCASHTSGTDMGTDWRDNDPKVEPIVEIYQGCRQNYEMPGAPRANTADDSIGGWRPLGFVSLALQKGYRLGFQASSDHISTHISYLQLLGRSSRPARRSWRR